MSMDEAQSTVSTSAGMPHHVTGTIAEEEQEEEEEGGESKGTREENPNWPAAAAAAAAGATAARKEWAQQGATRGMAGAVGAEGSVETGQSWNWAWLAAQLPSEHGAIDPSTLLDDESEGEGLCSQDNGALPLSMLATCCVFR